MKATILVILCLFYLNVCAKENIDNVQKALLVKTNLTKEELTQLLNSESASKFGTNNTSVEEVAPDSESETETEKIFKNLRNGKLKIKIKLELDLNDKVKANTESEDGPVVQTAFVQTGVIEMPKKISFFNYIMALLIMVILMSLFMLSSINKKNKNKILNKAKKNDDYLLQDN